MCSCDLKNKGLKKVFLTSPFISPVFNACISSASFVSFLSVLVYMVCFYVSVFDFFLRSINTEGYVLLTYKLSLECAVYSALLSNSDFHHALAAPLSCSFCNPWLPALLPCD